MKLRPTILEVLKEYGMDPLILIPKNGGLKGVVSTTLKEMEFDYLQFRKIDEDNYASGDLRVSIYRAEDIPKIVEDLFFDKKIKAVGLTGDDLYDEYLLKSKGTALQVLETVDWIDPKAKYLRPALCLMKRQGDKMLKEGACNIAVNRKYEITSAKFIEKLFEMTAKADYGLDFPGYLPEEYDCLRGFDPRIRVYNGNLEGTVAQGINDLCIEIVYTGESLQKNGLELVGKPIRMSDFVLIGINESSPLIFGRDYESIADRVRTPKKNSFTSALASDSNKARKKLGEEFAEFMQECCRYDSNKDQPGLKQKIAGEFADLFYAMSVNAAKCGLELKEITREMYRRLKRD